jgi:hypothetical protein
MRGELDRNAAEPAWESFMLRFVSLVRVHEGTDVDAIVSAGAKMCEEDADIQSGSVVAGLGLMRSYGAPEADYAMLLDFADEDAMNRWAAGPHHHAFDVVVGEAVDAFTVAQYHL